MLIAQVAVLLQSLVDDLFQFRRQIGIQTNRRNRRALENGIESDAGTFAAKWQLSGGHFVENDSEGEEIRARIQLLRAHLLRRHVGDRAECAARASEMVCFYRSCCHGLCVRRGIFRWADFSKAEIKKFCMPALGNENVCRLNIAM